MSNIYNRNQCATFRKTKEQYGGFSNMAGGYPIIIGAYHFFTSEHLYQAMRFPNYPDIQLEIIKPVSPMASKMVAKKYTELTRPNWNYLRIEIMNWCINLKLLQNTEKFGNLLISSGLMDIVEDSFKDDFWGAKPQNDDILIGLNVLGELLRNLRNRYIEYGISTIEHKSNLIEEKMLFNNEDLVKLLEKGQEHI